MRRALQSIHAKSATVLALALLCAIPYGIAAVASLALGGAIQMLNLFVLDRMVAGIRGLVGTGSGTRFQVVLGLRFLFVVGLTGWALLVLPTEPVAFSVGLGTLIPAAVWHGLESAHRTRARGI